MIGPALHMRQRPGLAITPRLAQSIRMLAMAPGEIDALVASEIDKNPFMHRVGGPAPVAARGGSAGEAIDVLEARTPATPSPVERIEAQIALAFRTAPERAVARFLASELDDAGYLREAPGAYAARAGVPLPMVERVLARLRLFEPAGLFARDLRDCLALQLAARDRLDPAMEALLGRLDLLARRDFDALRSVTGLDEADLLDALAEIRSCDPKPGAGRSDEPAPVIVPCARIVPHGDGFRAELVNAATPRVRVDREAAEMLLRRADAEAREWITARMGDAAWLERSLAQRARSILKVVAEVAERQADFMRMGEAALRPLTLRAVADDLGLHESTVSRVVAGKSVETPRGTVRLRSFFGAGVAAQDGALAARAVQIRISDLIRAERADAVLSDERLTGLLREEGIDIARRTVAKYREALGIGSSAQRRRELRAMATGSAGARARRAGAARTGIPA